MRPARPQRLRLRGPEPLSRPKATDRSRTDGLVPLPYNSKAGAPGSRPGRYREPPATDRPAPIAEGGFMTARGSVYRVALLLGSCVASPAPAATLVQNGK